MRPTPIFLLALALATTAHAGTTAVAERTDPGAAWQSDFDAGSAAAREHGLEQAVGFYERALEQALAMRPGDHRAFRTLTSLASTYTTLGLPRKAIEVHAHALELHELAGQGDSVAAAGAMEALARLHEKLGEDAIAEDLLRRALAIRESSGSSNARAQASAVGSALSRLAMTIERQRPEDPEAVELMERKLRLDDRPAVYAELARFHVARRDRERAIEHFRAAIDREDLEPSPNLGQSASWLAELAEQLAAAGRLEEAEESLLDALTLEERRLGSRHPYVADPLRRLGALLLEAGLARDAEIYLERSLALQDAAWGECHRCTRSTRELLDRVHEALGREDAVCQADSEEEEGEVERPEGLLELEQEVRRLRGRGELYDAIEVAGRALEQREQFYGADSIEAARGLDALGSLYRSQRKLPEARDAFGRSLAIVEREGDDEHVAGLLQVLGGLARDLDAADEAEALFLRELDLRDSNGQRLKAAQLLENLGRLERADENEAGAAEYFRLAAEAWEALAGVEAPEVLRNLTEMATSLGRSGRPDEAAETFEALLARVERGRDDHDGLLTVLRPALTLYEQSGREEDAQRTKARIDGVVAEQAEQAERGN